MAPAPRPPRRVPPLLIGAGVLVVAAGFGLPRLVVGAAPDTDPPSATAPTASEGPGLGWALARFAVCLAAVCGLCVGVARLTARRPPAPPAGMAVTAALALDPRCTVYLVTAGDRRLLVGIDAGGVKGVVELPGAVPVTPEPPPVAEAAPPPAGSVTVGPVRVAVAAVRDDIARLLQKLRHQPG